MIGLKWKENSKMTPQLEYYKTERKKEIVRVK